jgi:hypothetical protein
MKVQQEQEQHQIDRNVGKWANTSNPIDDSLNFKRSIKWRFCTGSEVVVLGWDPADTHTSNFWEELASVELGSQVEQQQFIILEHLLLKNIYGFNVIQKFNRWN